MGIALSSLVEAKEVELDYFRNKVVLIDAYNVLYQFLTSIRGPDGSALTDEKGRVTSHLVGLFGRTINLMQRDIKLAFVFDGTPPDLKKKTIEARKKLKQEAEEKLTEATSKEDFEEMKKYSSRTVRLTKDLVAEAKELLDYLGLPVIQAPSEGEAQASYMVSKGEAFCVGSQDFDSLVNGATRLARNLSIAGRRKKGKFNHLTVKPEIVELDFVLNSLGIDRKQLVALSMAVGTDYNPGGIKGIGPKNALKLIKKHGQHFDAYFHEIKWSDHFDFSWREVYDVIENIPTTDDYELQWKTPNKEELTRFLVDERGFSSDRINSSITKLEKQSVKKSQTSLADF